MPEGPQPLQLRITCDALGPDDSRADVLADDGTEPLIAIGCSDCPEAGEGAYGHGLQGHIVAQDPADGALDAGSWMS